MNPWTAFALRAWVTWLPRPNHVATEDERECLIEMFERCGAYAAHIGASVKLDVEFREKPKRRRNAKVKP